MRGQRGPVEERLWPRLDGYGSPEACWVWTGTMSKGYGVLMVNARTQRVHRVAYELMVGEIPEGLVLDHLCRNKACANPSHLEAVTQQVNVQRGLAGETQKARGAAITHCPKGHEYTPENTYTPPDGRYRACRECRREDSAARYAASKCDTERK